MLNKGDVINGTYQILDRIGSGGMGVIYLAYHVNLRKYVVIKRIKDNFVGRIEARGEVDIMKNLSHSYLPHIYDFIQLDTEIYTVMSYIEGYDFSYYVKNGCRFSEEQITKWLSQCLEVLEYLHSRTPAIIHRDIKPGNIMLDKDGNICVIDFNISFDEAKGTNFMAASEAYASPEQMHPRQVVQSNGQIGYQFDIDKRTDIYSLGATFYHIMTGIKPNEGIRSVYPITELDIGYSEALKKIVDRAMRPNPDDRYQSASQMLTAVKNIYKSTAKYRAVRAGIVAGACCIGMLIGTSVVLGYKVSKKRKTERFEKDYSQVIQISAETEPELALEKSISLLNEEDYSSVYNDNPTKKGTLLYQAALSYFVLEDYEEADKYFEEALDYINDPDCVRDYAISLAKGGDTYTAENVLRKNQDVLGEMNVRQIEAEISYVRGDYAEAEDNLEYVLQNTSNMADKCRNLILLSDVYAAQNKYDQMLQLVNDNNLPEEYASVREKILASAYIGLASEKEGSASDDYYKSAQSNLEKLKNNNLLDLDSAISLIVVYLNTGKLTEAENYLNVLSREYPNDYRVLVQQAFLDYNRQVSGKGDNYYFVTFKDHYEKAIKAYNEQNTDGKIDTNVEQLKKIYQQLKDKGYV